MRGGHVIYDRPGQRPIPALGANRFCERLLCPPDVRFGNFCPDLGLRQNHCIRLGPDRSGRSRREYGNGENGDGHQCEAWPPDSPCHRFVCPNNRIVELDKLLPVFFR